MKAVWDYIRTYGYVCYYTGMPLELMDIHSPWYMVFDHLDARGSTEIVITSALVNDMKSDLTEDEFWFYIAQLANHYRYGTKVEKIKLKPASQICHPRMLLSGIHPFSAKSLCRLH